MARDSRGRFYVVTPELGDDPPMTFAPDGSFLSRLGRAGSGPGEFRMPSVVLVLPGDSVLVVDRGLARYTVLSKSYELVRTAPIPPGATAATVLLGGELIMSARINTPSLAGLPLHELDANGNYIRSFGALKPIVRPGYPYEQARVLAPASDGGVWSAHMYHRYLIERWNSKGELEQEVERRADWFAPYRTYWLPTPTKAPAPTIMGLWEDESGLLWVIGWVGGANWAKGLGPARLLEGQVAYPITGQQAVYDGFLEVINPVQGVVVASTRFAGTMDIVVAPGIVAGVREGAEGWPYVDVWQVRLHRP